MIRFIFFSIVILQSLVLAGQDAPKITINLASIGAIADKNGKVLGTGFVVEMPNQVITCDHVLKTDSIYFHPSNNITQRFLLTPKYRMKAEDIAILFANEDTISNTPLEVGKSQKHKPGDIIFYVGFNQEESVNNLIAFKYHSGTIRAVGKVLNEGHVVPFFEIKGEGIPGYSGGPILNTEGRIIGVFREAWTMKGLRKESTAILMNRAFSLEPAIQYITRKSKKRRI